MRKTIIKGYGGGNDTEESIDPHEMVATLLIPYLVRECSNVNIGGGGSGTDSVVGRVVQMILWDVTGSLSPATINPKLIRKILVTYGEPELAEDGDLVRDMVHAANGGGQDIKLDEGSFAMAMSGDVQQYSVESEEERTSNYYDVFPVGGERSKRRKLKIKPLSLSPQDEEEGVVHQPSSSDAERNRPEELSTAAGIDYVSDTHTSTLFSVLIWLFFFMTQFTYLRNYVVIKVDREFECGDSFSCHVGRGIVRWLAIAVFYRYVKRTCLREFGNIPKFFVWFIKNTNTNTCAHNLIYFIVSFSSSTPFFPWPKVLAERYSSLLRVYP